MNKIDCCPICYIEDKFENFYEASRPVMESIYEKMEIAFRGAILAMQDAKVKIQNFGASAFSAMKEIGEALLESAYENRKPLFIMTASVALIALFITGMVFAPLITGLTTVFLLAAATFDTCGHRHRNYYQY